MEPMMDNSMMDGMMAICMIASTLFALAISVAVIIQTVVQVMLLREVREIRKSSNATGRNDIGPRQ